jgi:uncharacterized protein DUF4197
MENNMSFIYRQTPTLVIAALLTVSASINAGWDNWLDKAQKTLTGEGKTSIADSAVTSLSSSEIIDGLKQALIQGSKAAIDGLGKENGFLGNPDVRIPLPERLETLEKGLRALGQGDIADNFITSMNRAAEQAVPQAKNLFIDTISDMSLEDARAVLDGPNDAATQYLQKNSGGELQELMKPIVKIATDNVGVTSAYKNMFSEAGLLAKTIDTSSIDLDSYVTEQATNGLFKLIAAEEQRIRENPVARTSDLLKKVFSAAN